MAHLVYINGIATSHRQSHFDISEGRRATTESTSSQSTSSDDQVCMLAVSLTCVTAVIRNLDYIGITQAKYTVMVQCSYGTCLL